MKNKVTYVIGIFCGLLPLTIGLFIFFTWWAARAFFAIDLHEFPKYGLFWMMISGLIATAGLIIISYSWGDNPKFIRSHIFGFVLILVNIPVVYWVVIKQSDIDTRAYVKIYNKGVFDLSEVTLKSKEFEKQIGNIDCSTSQVIYYYPKYVNENRGESYPEMEKVELIISVRNHDYRKFLTLPEIDKGGCRTLYIDKEFNLLNKWE